MSDRRVVFSLAFTKDFKQLQKRYRRISDDLRPLLDQLRQGDNPGDQISGVGHTVYKVRLKNSDAKRGKSGGYRAVYYLEKAEEVAMISIYSKSDQSDIPLDVLRRIIEEYAAQSPPEGG
jgi:mRNA-degrading endonuclease RelE of RelBE toxin-antitoxin system